MKIDVIPLSQLEDYFKLCQLEQTFRVKLTQMEKMAERKLELTNELKVLAKHINNLKHSGIKFKFDKELNQQIIYALNRSFKGGIL